MQENELISRLKQNDEEAFRLVINENQKKVVNTCYRLVLDKESAEDIAQEVFIKVFTSIGQFRGDSKLSTWIYRIAVTKSLDHLRAQKRKKRWAFLKPLQGEDDTVIDVPAPEGDSPFAKIDTEERLKALNDAMNKLPENQKVALSLSKFDEMSSKEIADVMGTTVSAVESLIHRAKKNLEKNLYSYYKKDL